MENNILHPSKRVWVEMAFGEELTPEQKDERQMIVWQRLKTEGRPIIGISHQHSEAMGEIPTKLIDFFVLDCSKSVDGDGIEVLMQYWGDVEECPELTTRDVMFSFLVRNDEIFDVNYATLRPRKIITPTLTW